MGLIENLKEVAELIKKAGDIDLYRKIVEAEGESMELARANHDLEEKVRHLEKALALQKEMLFKRPFYYQEGDETPYCANCWEAKTIAVHVVFKFENEYRTRWDCPQCNHSVVVQKQPEPSEAPSFRPRGPQGWMG